MTRAEGAVTCLPGASLTGACLTGAWLTGARLTRAGRAGAGRAGGGTAGAWLAWAVLAWCGAAGGCAWRAGGAGVVGGGRVVWLIGVFSAVGVPAAVEPVVGGGVGLTRVLELALGLVVGAPPTGALSVTTSRLFTRSRRLGTAFVVPRPEPPTGRPLPAPGTTGSARPVLTRTTRLRPTPGEPTLPRPRLPRTLSTSPGPTGATRTPSAVPARAPRPTWSTRYAGACVAGTAHARRARAGVAGVGAVLGGCAGVVLTGAIGTVTGRALAARPGGA
ncbi:pentapeptide repeat-containing protein [Kribbella sp. NPDC059898]|uniref:pentapeptide repeat-containing protein n=1 Tax=Kribbella sp. NPDC059898 TaxID=3346995 RepID=UPI0036650388